MTFTLSTSIKKGNKIKTGNGWREVKEVTDLGVVVKDGFIGFGQVIHGYKNK